jgi:hypothetical protein
MKGSRHWLISVPLPTISVTLGLKAVCRLLKFLNRSASARVHFVGVEVAHLGNAGDDVRTRLPSRFKVLLRVARGDFYPNVEFGSVLV